MHLRHLAAATTFALACATLSHGPAQAHPDADQVARGKDHFPTTISTTVSPGGTSMITTPTIDKDVKTLTVTVKPKGKDPLDAATYDEFVNTVGTLTKGQKLLTCVLLYKGFTTSADPDGEYAVAQYFYTLAGAVLLACLQMAGLVATNDRASKQTRSAAASQKCGQIRPSLPATVKKVDGGYSVKASGVAKKAKKPKLKVKCKTTGHKVSYTIRSSKKGGSLRKAAGGNKIMVGMKSPDDAETSVPVKVTFNTP